MQIKTILNHIQKFKSFVYGEARLLSDTDDCVCLYLPAWHLQVESDRASLVQRDQQELKRLNARQL